MKIVICGIVNEKHSIISKISGNRVFFKNAYKKSKNLCKIIVIINMVCADGLDKNTYFSNITKKKFYLLCS